MGHSAPTSNEDEDLKKAIALSLVAEQNTDTWDEPIPSPSRAVVRSNSNTSSSNIPTQAKMPTTKKSKDDDIFASVGITSIPQFSKLKNAAPTVPKPTTTSNSTFSSLLAAQEIDDDEESNWGDEDD